MLAVLVLFALVPAKASAAFHLMKVREVFPSAADGDFVELQMFSGGQNVVSGHEIDVYNGAGTVIHTYPMPSNVMNGENQRTVLIGASGAAGFPDFVDSGLDIPAAAGAVCFPDGQPMDCVTWGAFNEQIGFPNHQTANAAGIPAGMSLTRSIAPGNSALLEPGDDTDNSANDFAAMAPTPSCNRAATIDAVAECSAPPAPPPDPPPPTPDPGADPTPDPGADPSTPVTPPPLDTIAPNTVIDKAPKGTIDKDRARISFSSDEPGSLFACKLDKAAYKSCTSPRTYKNLADGKHTVLVRATDLALNTDPSAAKATFKVDIASRP